MGHVDWVIFLTRSDFKDSFFYHFNYFGYGFPLLILISLGSHVDTFLIVATMPFSGQMPSLSYTRQQLHTSITYRFCFLLLTPTQRKTSGGL